MKSFHQNEIPQSKEATQMNNPNRREFLGGLLGSVGATAALGATANAQTSSASPTADVIVTNGKLYTMDDHQPTAEAVAIQHGRFIAIGAAKDVLNLKGPTTEIID